MRLPRLARVAGVYVAAPVFQRSIYFLLIPIFTRFLTPAEYGAWGYVTVVGTMLGTFAPLGLLSSFGYSIRRPQSWQCGAERIRSASLQMSIALVAIAVLVAYPLCLRIDLGIENQSLLWIVVFASTVIGYPALAAKRRYQMLEQPGPFAGMEIAGGLTIALVSYLGVAIWGWGPVGLAAGPAAGALIVMVPALKSLHADLWRRTDRAAVREAMLFGLPLFIHTGAAVLLQYVDRFMLERMSSMHELGLYSLAGQIGTVMTIVTTATNQAYLPFLYRQFEDRPNLVKRAQRYVALFYAGIGMVGVVAVPLFLRYFIDPRYAEAQLAAQVLLVGGIFHGFYHLMVGRLMVARRTVTIAAVTVVCAALNIGLNLYLIPRMQSEGAAWATLIAEVALFGVLWYFARGVQPDADTAEGV